MIFQLQSIPFALMTSETPAMAATSAAPDLGRGRFATSTRLLADALLEEALSPACSWLAEALSALLSSRANAGLPPACCLATEGGLDWKADAS